MVEVQSSLAHFEDPNRFQALQLKNEECVEDVESPEEILNRLIRYASELATKEATSDDVAYDAKKRSFEEGELEEGWTIVACRRPRRYSIPVQQTEDDEEDIPSVMEEKPIKPRKWRRGILALGTAAALGLASMWLHRRLRQQHQN